MAEKIVDEKDPLRDMSKHGWRKSLTWLDVRDLDDGKYILSEIDYNTQTLHCHGCNTNEYLWLVPQRVGVFIACVMCETVDGPVARDFGDIVSTKEIQPSEALMILESRGAFISKRLRKLVGKKLSRFRRGERPKERY